MKKLILGLVFSVSLLLAGCKGEQGPIGPQGPAGSTGAQGTSGAVGATGPQGVSGVAGIAGPQGPVGPQGPQGPAASQPTVYDYTVDLSKSLITWEYPKPLGDYDVAFTYVMVNKGSGYALLPFRNYAYTADQKDFIKLDAYVLQYTSFLSFRNDSSVPTGATFWMRTVIIKGAKGGRLDMSRYQNYDNLKADYNLID